MKGELNDQKFVLILFRARQCHVLSMRITLTLSTLLHCLVTHDETPVLYRKEDIPKPSYIHSPEC